MERIYTLEFTQFEYARLIKLIDKDEENRTKNRERARSRAPSDSFKKPTVLGKIQYKIVSVNEIPKSEVNMNTNISQVTS